MANFNLEDYEPVHERIAKFYDKYEDGRIITDLHTFDIGTKIVVFKVTLYKSGDDFNNASIFSTGWAQETIGQGYVNTTSALENCETSAIGRALANIGLHGDKRPSREEMQKASDSKPVMQEKEIQEKYNEFIDKIPLCQSAKELVSIGSEIKGVPFNERQIADLRLSYNAKLKELDEKSE